MKIILIAFLLLSASLRINAQQEDSVTTDVTWDQIQEKISIGRQYTIVFLKAGPVRQQLPEEELEKLQIAHLKYLFSLKEQGKLPLFGPFTQSGDLRGICIFNLTDKTAIQALMDKDPHVKSGRLIYEMHPWFGLPGDQLPDK